MFALAPAITQRSAEAASFVILADDPLGFQGGTVPMLRAAAISRHRSSRHFDRILTGRAADLSDRHHQCLRPTRRYRMPKWAALGCAAARRVRRRGRRPLAGWKAWLQSAGFARAASSSGLEPDDYPRTSARTLARILLRGPHHGCDAVSAADPRKSGATCLAWCSWRRQNTCRNRLSQTNRLARFAASDHWL